MEVVLLGIRSQADRFVRLGELETEALLRSLPQRLEQMTRQLDQAFSEVRSIRPYGGMALEDGSWANGPAGPALTKKKL